VMSGEGERPGGRGEKCIERSESVRTQHWGKGKERTSSDVSILLDTEPFLFKCPAPCALTPHCVLRPLLLPLPLLPSLLQHL
jgi:hypothetical protein